MAAKIISSKMRVGKINFINTIPFYSGLPLDPSCISVTEGSPTEINRAMEEGRLDFAPISSLAYAQSQADYLIFPDLCIGSRDFARSVLLLSHERIDGLDQAKIILSEKSLSSQALLKALLRFKYGLNNSFESSNESPEAMLAKGKAVLAIGDEALFFRPKRFLYKYDLSELWWNWTDLPFCFALWAVRRNYYEAHQKEAHDFHRLLLENTERNMVDIEKLLRDELKMTISDERFTHCFGYLFNLNFYLDQKMRKGLMHFYEYAARLGLSPEVKNLHFIEKQP